MVRLKETLTKMSDNCNNLFESIISSFDIACMHLDNKVTLQITETKEQLEKDITSAEGAISEFNQAVNDISVATDELSQSETLLKRVRKNSLQRDTLLLSQDLQADSINSIKDMYNLSSPFVEVLEKKLVNDQFRDSSDLIQKVIVRTINQANNMKNTLLTNMRLTENN